MKVHSNYLKTLVVLCEPAYDPELKTRLPKRAQRQGSRRLVWYNVLASKTFIEHLVETKEAIKAVFTADAFEETTSQWLEQIAVVARKEDGDVVDGLIATAALAVVALDVEEGEISM